MMRTRSVPYGGLDVRLPAVRRKMSRRHTIGLCTLKLSGRLRVLKLLREAPAFESFRGYGSSMAPVVGGSVRVFASIRLADGTLRKAELHWYEASGLGKFEFKIKRFVD